MNFPSLEVNSGEALVITGVSGAGKTTWLHLLCGLIKPLAGKISWEGSMKPKLVLKHLIAYQPQLPLFFNHLTAMENLQRMTHLAGGDLKAIAPLINDLGLNKIVQHKPSTWSAGEQQRMNLAQALLRPCPLLFADEPTAHLDDDACQLVVAKYHEALQKGRSLLVVSHDIRMQSAFPNHLAL